MSFSIYVFSFIAGRILNRFSKDTGAMDETLPITLLESIVVFSIMVGVVIQVLIIKSYALIPMLLCGYFYLKIRNIYLTNACGVKRLEGAGILLHFK